MARGENQIVARSCQTADVAGSQRGRVGIVRLSEQGSLAGVARLHDADNMTLG